MTYLSKYGINIDFNVEKIIELPIEDFDMVPYGRFNYIGVYVLDFKSGKRYIGRSSSPRRRINQHWNKINDVITFITIFIVELNTHAKILEETLVRHLKPEYNKIFIGDLV